MNTPAQGIGNRKGGRTTASIPSVDYVGAGYGYGEMFMPGVSFFLVSVKLEPRLALALVEMSAMKDLLLFFISTAPHTHRQPNRTVHTRVFVTRLPPLTRSLCPHCH